MVALAMPGVSAATEWVVDSSVRLGLEYNDNIFLTTFTHEPVSGASLSANLDFGARQETWEMWGDARLVSKRYVDRDDLDTDNVIGNLRYEFRTERSLLALKGSYADESILSTETIDPDIGLIQQQTKRTTTNINPAWGWSLTETTQLRLDYQYVDAQYEDGISVNLLDYRQQAVSVTIAEQLAERTSIYAILSHSLFEVTSPESQITTNYTSSSRTNTAQLGVSHDITETLKVSVSGGPRKTTSDEVAKICGPFLCPVPITLSNTSYGSVFKGSLESRLELTRTTLSFSRAVSPSGSGGEVETGNLTLAVDRQLTPERLSVRLVAEGYRFKALGTTSSSIDRNYYRLEPALRWRWTEDLDVDISYRYMRQRYVDAPDYAAANAVYLAFSYRPTRISLSR